MTAVIKTERDLRELLVDLGGSHGAVAATLAAAGIKGVRGDMGYCPVARWLRRETGARMVEVDQASVVVHLPDGPVRTASPLAVNYFVGQFDNYAYPELDESPPPGPDGDDPEF